MSNDKIKIVITRVVKKLYKIWAHQKTNNCIKIYFIIWKIIISMLSNTIDIISQYINNKYKFNKLEVYYMLLNKIESN